MLAGKTILKEDHFPGCQNVKLRPLVDGAPNFRQARYPWRQVLCQLLSRRQTCLTAPAAVS